MRQKDVLKALEGQENVIAPAVEANERFFKRVSCPGCGSEVIPIVNEKQLFREGSILPNFLARCRTCQLEFEPYTGIIVKRATP